MTTQEQHYIRWKTTPLEGGLFALQITDQSHRSFTWGSRNGTIIRSTNEPEYCVPVLCVRGSTTSRDNKPIILNDIQLADCERALTEYNFAHSEFACWWEISEDGDGVYSQKYGVLPYEKDTEYPRASLRVRRKKSDEEKAREAFAANEYVKDWEIVGWRSPRDGDTVFGGVKLMEHVQPFGPATNPMLVIRRKHPPAPTGEACVGCLCRVCDSKDGEYINAIVEFDHRPNTKYPYRGAGGNWWKNAVPLTPDEVMVYLEKSKEAWKK